MKGWVTKYQNPKWMRAWTSAKMRFLQQAVWLNRRFDSIKACNPVAGGTNSVNPHNSVYSARPCQSLWAIQRQQNPERVQERTQQRFAQTLPLQHSTLHQNIVSHPLIAWCWYRAFLWLAVKSTFFAGTRLKINRKEDIDRCVRARTGILSCWKRPSVICLSLPYWYWYRMQTLLIQQCAKHVALSGNIQM